MQQISHNLNLAVCSSHQWSTDSLAKEKLEQHFSLLETNISVPTLLDLIIKDEQKTLVCQNLFAILESKQSDKEKIDLLHHLAFHTFSGTLIAHR